MSFLHLPTESFTRAEKGLKKRKAGGKKGVVSPGGLLLRPLHNCIKALCSMSLLWLGQAWTFPTHIRTRAGPGRPRVLLQKASHFLNSLVVSLHRSDGFGFSGFRRQSTVGPGAILNPRHCQTWKG